MMRNTLSSNVSVDQIMPQAIPTLLLKPTYSTQFRHVSECYVDGIMDGRALQMWQNGELDEEEFLLR